MIDFIKSLKSPKQVKASSIRNYGTNTPSVTWLLSLIDSYEPKNEEALERWTYVHTIMETLLWWLPIRTWSHNDFVASLLPYLYLFKWLEWDKLELEKKITITWVFWWTIDYIKVFAEQKEKEILCAMSDYKTTMKLWTTTWPLKEKYEHQLKMYKKLLAYENYKVVEKNLFYISPKGCMIDTIWSSWFMDDTTLDLLLMYYHGINKSLLKPLIAYYDKMWTSWLRTIVATNNITWVKDKDSLAKVAIIESMINNIIKGVDVLNNIPAKTWEASNDNTLYNPFNNGTDWLEQNPSADARVDTNEPSEWIRWVG